MDIYQVIASYILPIIISGALAEIIKIGLLTKTVNGVKTTVFDKIGNSVLKWLAVNGYTIGICLIVCIPVIFITFQRFDAWQYIIYSTISWLFSGKGYDAYKKFIESK